jgi:hypothetical protein
VFTLLLPVALASAETVPDIAAENLSTFTLPPALVDPATMPLPLEIAQPGQPPISPHSIASGLAKVTDA